MMNLSCPEYLKEAESHLLKEENLGQNLFHAETKVLVMTAAHREIIEKHA